MLNQCSIQYTDIARYLGFPMGSKGIDIVEMLKNRNSTLSNAITESGPFGFRAGDHLHPHNKLMIFRVFILSKITYGLCFIPLADPTLKLEIEKQLLQLNVVLHQASGYITSTATQTKPALSFTKTMQNSIKFCGLLDARALCDWQCVSLINHISRMSINNPLQIYMNKQRSVFTPMGLTLLARENIYFNPYYKMYRNLKMYYTQKKPNKKEGALHREAARELRFRLIYPGEEERYRFDTPLEHHSFSSLLFRVPTIYLLYINHRYCFTLEKTPAGLSCIGCGARKFTTSHFTCPLVLEFTTKLITPQKGVEVTATLLDALSNRKRYTDMLTIHDQLVHIHKGPIAPKTLTEKLFPVPRFMTTLVHTLRINGAHLENDFIWPSLASVARYQQPNRVLWIDNPQIDFNTLHPEATAYIISPQHWKRKRKLPNHHIHPLFDIDQDVENNIPRDITLSYITSSLDPPDFISSWRICLRQICIDLKLNSNYVHEYSAMKRPSPRTHPP